MANKKQEEQKQEDNFNFDIGGAGKVQQSNSAAPQGSGDLMDLLGGGPTNNQTSNSNQGQNALDFFSQGAG